MTAKPTIVLVTGAFHVASHMSLFESSLKEVGYTCISFGLKTVNTPKLTLQDDVDYLHEALQGLIVDQGKEVVLYLHSYAGFPGSAAIEGLSNDEQKTQGNQGGVIGLIYQSAFIPKEGDCLYNLIGGEYAPWQAPNFDTSLVMVPDPMSTFFHDVSHEAAIEAIKNIFGQSLLSFHAKSGSVFYQRKNYDGRRMYIHTEDDQALPTFVMDTCVQNSGVGWDVLKVKTSHSPFLSQPGMLAGIVEKAILSWEGKDRK